MSITDCHYVSDFARDEVVPDQTPELVKWLYSREKRTEKYLLELAIDSIRATVEAEKATKPLYKNIIFIYLEGGDHVFKHII